MFHYRQRHHERMKVTQESYDSGLFVDVQKYFPFDSIITSIFSFIFLLFVLSIRYNVQYDTYNSLRKEIDIHIERRGPV